MGLGFSFFAWSMICGLVFIPVLIAAWVMLRSAGRAFALAVVFSAGALTAFLACGLLGSQVLDVHGANYDLALIGFATAGAIGGGALAIFVFGKLSRQPPWRRD
jgi:hypothetical protein